MTDNQFHVRPKRLGNLDPSDWTLTPTGRPVRARYRTIPVDAEVLELMGYQPPRPNAPVIRVDRGIQTRGFHAGEAMAGKILAAPGDPGEWPTLDYPRIVVIGGLLDDAEVQFVIADRRTGPDDEIRWEAQNLAGDRVGEFWKNFDRIDDWVRWVPVASPYWPTAQRIMILAGRIGVNQVKTAQVAERVDYKPGDPEPETYPRYRVTHGTHRGAVLWEGGSAVGSYVVLEEGTKPVTPPARPTWPAEERIYVRSARMDGFDVQDLIGTRIDHPSGERHATYPRYEMRDLDGDCVGELWNDQPEDVDQITDWVPCPIREDATEWPTAKRIQVLAGTIDNERITAPVVAERVDWHENAFSAQECFPKYRIVQGTAPVGATDVFYRSYDSDRITRYAVLEEGDND